MCVQRKTCCHRSVVPFRSLWIQVHVALAAMFGHKQMIWQSICFCVLLCFLVLYYWLSTSINKICGFICVIPLKLEQPLLAKKRTCSAVSFPDSITLLTFRSSLLYFAVSQLRWFNLSNTLIHIYVQTYTQSRGRIIHDRSCFSKALPGSAMPLY